MCQRNNNPAKRAETSDGHQWVFNATREKKNQHPASGFSWHLIKICTSSTRPGQTTDLTILCLLLLASVNVKVSDISHRLLQFIAGTTWAYLIL